MKVFRSAVVALGLGLAASLAIPASAEAKSGARFAAPQQVDGQTVAFRLLLKGFRIDSKNVGKANRAGSGHIHFQMDGGRYDYARSAGAAGALAEKIGTGGKYSPSFSPAITYTKLSKGPHRLVAYLNNNDHSKVGIIAVVKFTVK